MNPVIIIAALIGAFAVIFSISPVYGIAFVTTFRTLSILVAVPIGSYTYSGEGFLTLAIIAGGFIFVLLNFSRLKGISKWPFIIFILYCMLTILVADDLANFFKKIARLVGYLFLYLTVTQLSTNEKNRKILSYGFIASLFVTNIPAIYMYFIMPDKYMKFLQRGEQEIGIMMKNNFGFYCCFMMYFLIYMYSVAKSKFSKGLFILLFVVQTALLVLSFTRAAWVAFVAAFPFLIFYSKKKMRLLVPFLITIIVIAFFSSIVYYGAYKDLTEKKEYGFSSWHFRTAYAWPASIKAFQKRPIMGWGLGNDLYALAKAANLKKTSHNDYLLVLVETGSIGLLLYVWLLISFFRKTAAGIRNAADEQSRMLCVSALAILISYLVGSIAENVLQTPGATGYLVTVLGMAHGTLLEAPKHAVTKIQAKSNEYPSPVTAQ
jgi:O-antigen ligase